jgi:hypothetical protein
MSLVCTLDVGALRRFWVKSSDFIEKALKINVKKFNVMTSFGDVRTKNGIFL